MEEYGLSFFREISVHIVEDLIWSDFLHGASSSKSRQYMHVGKVMLRHPCLWDVVKKLTTWFSSSHCSEVSALYDVAIMECDEEATVFLIGAPNAFIPHQNEGIYASPFSQLLCY